MRASPLINSPFADSQAPLFLPCANGVEALLEHEATALLAPSTVPLKVTAGRGGVYVEVAARRSAAAERGAALATAAMRCNLHSRLAQRVLWPLAEGAYRDEHDLYVLARQVPWALWITPAQTLKVDVSARRSPLRSLNFAALRIKDAVCDQLREATGERPSVDTRQPDLPLLLFVGETHAALYADLSGEPLFKRGWREDTGDAPLKETLAAALLAAAGWQGRAEDGPLLDPFCGAGTIAIEAAQIACGIAAGSQRRFAFERMAPFQPLLPQWRGLQQAARAHVHAPAVLVHAGDVSFRMTDFALRNAQRAGVAHAIEFKAGDALQRPAPWAQGTMVFNPPYGERIDPKGSAPRAGRQGFARREEPAASEPEGNPGASAEARAFFDALAAHWKRHYGGWTAWVLSPDMKLSSALRLKESRRVPLWNGPIECRLFRYDLRAAGATTAAPDAAAA